MTKDRQKKILLVEDEAIITLSESKVIREYGYEVVIASTGERAIKFIQNDPYINLILMDINLGRGMNGEETAQEILRLRDIPIVFLTAYTDKETLEKVKNVTRYGYVLKGSGEFVLISSIEMAYKLFEAYKGLEESEKRYKRITESITDYIYTVRIENGKAVKTVHGDACFAVTGYKKEDFAADPFLWFRMIPELDREFIQEQIEKVLSGETTHPLEHHIIRKDGQKRWVMNSMIPNIDPQGNLLSYEGVIHDITERKKSEELLKESEEKFFKAFYHSPVAMSITSVREGCFLDVNDAYLRDMEWTREEMIGHTSLELNIWVNPEQRLECINILQNNKRLENYPVTIRSKTGKIFEYLFFAEMIYLQEKSYLIISAVNITESKRAEEALQKSEIKYRNIFENAVEGFFQTTPEGRFLSVNPALSRMMGFDSPEEMIAYYTDIEKQHYVNPEDRNIFKKLLEQNTIIQAYETQFYKKDKSIIWTSRNGRVVYDADGKILYYEGTIEDITNRKQAEEEKAHLESQLRQSQKMEAIGTLAGGVAHDFNNLLTVISGFSQLLDMEMRENDPKKEFIEQIIAASDRAADLTRSLLAFSRKQQVTLKPLIVNDIVKNITKLLKRLITEDIKLSISLSERNFVIMADATQMDQILINLATNARDAMPKGGTLTLETKTITLDNEFMRIHGYGEPGSYALLSVSDTGIGMDEEIKGKIFDPFFTTKGIGKGTGLGLATIYGAVKQHNGYITVYSEPNQGTTFRIYLPLLDIEKEHYQSPLPKIPKGVETILIAEDDSGIRMFLTETLKRYGYTTITASDGEDALYIFKENQSKIDLILLDVVMPKKNGKEVYDEIVKTHPDMKIIFMSGHTGDVILDKGIENHLVDFMAKPLLPNELLLKVREVLDRLPQAQQRE